MAGSSNVLIVVHCDDCRDVRVRTCDVTLRNCVDDDSWAYWFVCPSCHQRNAAGTERVAALEAVAAGSTLELWHLPAELDQRSYGPALCGVDLLEFHLGFTEPDWIDELL